MDIHTINRKLFSGFLTLTFRRAVLLALNFITINIILAKILPVSVIGIFNVANSILAFFTYFSDIGLAAALIQKKDVNHDDLKTTFTVQEGLAFVICVVIFMFAPQFAQFYSLDESGMWLIRALAVGFFLTSLKVIPSVLLERELNFGKLVWVEISEAVVFNIVLIGLVISGFEVWSFAYAVVARGLVGTVLLNLISPWKIRLGFSWDSAKGLINFGLPFQANSLLALVKDRLIALLVARMVGTVGVGYITWAQSMAFMALEIMNIMTRISFPAYARLQDDREALGRTLERTLFATSLMLYPLLFGLLAVAPSLVFHVVSPKWVPALPMIYLFAITVFWATLSSPFTNFLNATGKINITLKLMVMWTALEWLITPILTWYFSFYGVAIASSLIAFTSIIPIIIIKKQVQIRIIKNILHPLIASVIMSAAVFMLSYFIVVDFITLLAVVLSGAIFYAGLIYLIARDQVTTAFRSIKNV